MKHGPFSEQSFRNLAEVPQLHVDMPVVIADPIISIADVGSGAFEHLNEDILPTNKRARNLVTRIAPPRVQQNAVERWLIVAKWTR